MRCPSNTIISADSSHCIPNPHFILKSEKSGDPLVYHALQFSTVINDNATDEQNTIDYRVCKQQGPYCSKGYFGPVF